MTEKPPHTPYEDVRRAGLNPLSDYGGRDQIDTANIAIEEAKKALGVTKPEEPVEQLSLLSGNTVDVNPEAVPNRRAVLGSRALIGAKRIEISEEDDSVQVEKIGKDDGTGRSTASKRRQAEIDSAEERRQMRLGLNARGWGRGPRS